jgi:hypothetical protein
MTCAPRRMLFRCYNKEGYERWVMWREWERRYMHATFWWVNLIERKCLEDQGWYERTILNCVLNKQDGGIWNTLIWLRIVARDLLLSTWEWTYRYYKMEIIFWLAEKLLASQEWLLHGVSKYYKFINYVYSKQVFALLLIRKISLTTLRPCKWCHH